MKTLILIVPYNNSVIVQGVPCNDKFKSSREVCDYMCRCSVDFGRVEMSEHNYQLDEIAAEILNTKSLVFIHPRVPVKGMGNMSVGRKNLNGPIIVCNDKYAGFERVDFVIGYLKYIDLWSMADAEVKQEKSLAELMQEYGRKP